MFEQNQITLFQIANGWLVSLPYLPEARPDTDTIFGISEDFLRKSVRIQVDELNKYPLLEELKGEVEEIPKMPVPKRPRLTDLKNERMYYFLNYNDALHFMGQQLSGNGDGGACYAMAE